MLCKQAQKSVILNIKSPYEKGCAIFIYSNANIQKLSNFCVEKKQNKKKNNNKNKKPLSVVPPTREQELSHITACFH